MLILQLYQLHDTIFLYFLDVYYENILLFFTLTTYSFYIFMLSCPLSLATIQIINNIPRQVENCRVCFYLVVWGWFVLKDIFYCRMIKGEESNERLLFLKMLGREWIFATMLIWSEIQNSKLPLLLIFVFRFQTFRIYFTLVEDHEEFVLLAFEQDLAYRYCCFVFTFMYVRTIFRSFVFSDTWVGHIKVMVAIVFFLSISFIHPPEPYYRYLILGLKIFQCLFVPKTPFIIFDWIFQGRNRWIHEWESVCIVCIPHHILLDQFFLVLISWARLFVQRARSINFVK